MLEQVGEKIKTIRKELKMTQSQLAGEEITKSMLSQIENNVSKPSIKTLQFIANKLNKPITYFLDETNDTSGLQEHTNSQWTQALEESIRVIDGYIDQSLLKQAQDLAEVLLASYTAKTHNRLLEDVIYKLGKSLVQVNNFDQGEKYIHLFIRWCLLNKYYLEATKATMELSKRFLHQYQYKECLNVIEDALEIYKKSINTDVTLEIELYHYKILVLSSVMESDQLLKLIDETLNISERSQMYYKTGDLYRIKAVVTYLNGDYEAFDGAIKKAYQFAEFSGDKAAIANIHLTQSIVEIEKKEPEKALEQIELHYHYMGKKIYLYYLQKAKAYYLLGKYQEAYEYMQHVEFPTYPLIKLDYYILWSSKIYEGLILNKLNKYQDALNAMLIGIEKMQIFGASNFLATAYKNIADVYSEGQDFENAFKSLKKADQVQLEINNKGGIAL